MIKSWVYVMWPDATLKGYERHLVKSVQEAREKAQGHEDWAIEQRFEGVVSDGESGTFESTWILSDGGSVKAKGLAAKALLARLEDRGKA